MKEAALIEFFSIVWAVIALLVFGYFIRIYIFEDVYSPREIPFILLLSFFWPILLPLSILAMPLALEEDDEKGHD